MAGGEIQREIPKCFSGFVCRGENYSAFIYTYHHSSRCGYSWISSLEWIALVFAIGGVFVTETLNTAIEIDIDLTSPEYHPFARDTKDVAAAAVLLSVFVAIIVGLIIFLPKIMNVV